MNKGKWVILEETPSELITNGIPRNGEIVEVKFTATPLNPRGCSRINSPETSSVMRAKKSGMTLFFSAI